MRLVTFPVYVMVIGTSPLLGRRKAFSSAMQWVSLIPGVTGEWLRRGVLQWVTGSHLKDCCISFGTLFSDPDLNIGDGVYIGPRCDIGRVRIGKNTIVASNVQITSGRHQHSFDDPEIPIRDQAKRFDTVVIGAGAWIGSGATVCADVGAGAVIGAGAVVVKPVPDGCILTGGPEIRIRHR